jgi:hypothetical protein
MRTPPKEYASTEAWARFEAWYEENHAYDYEKPSWEEWWECFLAGHSLGLHTAQEL